MLTYIWRLNKFCFLSVFLNYHFSYFFLNLGDQKICFYSVFFNIQKSSVSPFGSVDTLHTPTNKDARPVQGAGESYFERTLRCTISVAFGHWTTWRHHHSGDRVGVGLVTLLARLSIFLVSYVVLLVSLGNFLVSLVTFLVSLVIFLCSLVPLLANLSTFLVSYVTYLVSLVDFMVSLVTFLISFVNFLVILAPFLASLVIFLASLQVCLVKLLYRVSDPSCHPQMFLCARIQKKQSP